MKGELYINSLKSGYRITESFYQFYLPEGLTLVEKVNASDLESRLRDLLKVEPGASLRQLKRARDREIQRHQNDYLSNDQSTSTQARERLDHIHLAFDCLSNQSKLKEYLEKVNKSILTGEATMEELLPTEYALDEVLDFDVDNNEEGDKERPSLKVVESDVPVITPVEDSNIIAGPHPGAPIPVTEVQDDTITSGTVFTKAEEERRVKELKENQEEKERQQEKNKTRRAALLKKKSLKMIKEVAYREARKKADELRAKNKQDFDYVYDQVFKSAKAGADKVAEDQIAKMKRMDLSVDEEITIDFENFAEETAEAATEKEYYYIKKETPVKGKPNNRVFLLTITLAGLAVFFYFTNFSAMLFDKFLDPTGSKAKAKPFDPNTPVTHPVDKNLTLSNKPWEVQAQGLSPISGVAGMAGFATSLEIPGSADYNAALHKSYSRQYDQAIEQFKSSFKRNNNLYQTPYNIASLYYWKRDYQNAQAEFSNSIKLRPDLAQASFNKGVMLLEQALHNLNNPAGTKSKDIELTRSQSTGLIHDSITQFDIAMKMSPELAHPLYNRGYARYMLGDLKGAWEDFKEAYRLNKSMNAAKYNMKVIQIQIKNNEKAPPKAEKPIPPAPEGPVGPPGPGYL